MARVETAPRAPEDVRVSDEGLMFRSLADVPVDVLFDGRRIASVWSERDTTAAAGGDTAQRTWTWPPSLQRRLAGRVELSLSVHGADEPFYAEQVVFGGVEEPLRLVDGRGNPLALDKADKLVTVFEGRGEAQIAPLMESMRTVIGALQDAGIEPFLAYGTLLGAVREGGLIGHDSDADLGYVSEHDHPADICLESFELQRRLTAAGYEVYRYSGGAFKVVVVEGDGARRGLDVFAGFLRDGHLYLMGEVGTHFRPEWVRPLTTAQLEGRTFPVPAVPEKFLEAMYGASWRVPDPAYKFLTPRSTTRRLNGWFRGTRVNLEGLWGPHYSDPVARRQTRANAFVDWVLPRLEATDTVVDLGCGTGRDAIAYARAGHDTLGMDYLPRAYGRRAARAAQRGIPARFDHLNLNEVRSVGSAAATCARLPGRTVMTARHLLDAVDRGGRANLLRLARSVLSGGGTLYLQVWVGDRDDAPFGVRPLRRGTVLAEIEAAGGTVVTEELRHDDTTGTPAEAEGPTGDVTGEATAGGPRPGSARIWRLAVEWR